MHALNRHAAFAIAVFAIVAMAVTTMACAGPAAPQPAAPQPTAMPAATAAAPPATETPVPAPPTNTPASPTQAPAEATAAPSATDTPVPPTPTAEGSTAAAVYTYTFTLGEGTVARYKVEEVLANTGFKVATGETADVSGQIVFDDAGNVVADRSRIAVQAATLRTDSNRRDGYVRNRTLETDTWPEVAFVPKSFDGLPAPIADTGGQVEFTITGDLTVRDQTREVTWDAAAEFAGDGTVTGSASVEFTFDEFGMDKPRVAIVVSVEDTILLELDFAGTITLK